MAFQAKGFMRVCINFYSRRTKFNGTGKTAFEFNRKSRFLNKLLAENAAERLQWSKGLPTHKVFGSSSLSPKRLETLNRLFLSTITDGLTTSTRCEELADRGLLVSRTELSKCGQSLRVMWSSCSAENDILVEKILEECLEEIRNNIVTKSIGGFVPRIIFTKDIQVTTVRDIEHILTLPSVVKDLATDIPKAEDAEDELKEDRFKVEVSTNILGLKRDDILKRVIVTAKRLRRAERKQGEREESDGDPEVGDGVPERLLNIDVRRQKSAISAFMRKQTKVDKEMFINKLEGMRSEEYFGNDYDKENDVDHELHGDIDEEEDYYDFTKSEENTAGQTDLEGSGKLPA